MKLYELEVPIPNYYNDGIFMQRIYVLSESYPNPKQWQNIIINNHKRDSQFPEYIGDWRAVGIILAKAIIEKRFPILHGDLVQTNTFIETSFGKQPITAKIVPVTTLI